MHDLHYIEIDRQLGIMEKALEEASHSAPFPKDFGLALCMFLKEVLVSLDSLMNRAVEQDLEPRHGSDMTMLTCCKAGHDFQVRGNRLLCPRCGEVR